MSDQGTLNKDIKSLLQKVTTTPVPQIKQSGNYQPKHNIQNKKATQNIQKPHQTQGLTHEQIAKLKDNLVDFSKPSEKVQSLMSQKLSAISQASSQRRVIYKGINNGLKNDPMMTQSQSNQSIFQSVYKQDYLSQDQKRQISVQQLKDQYQMQLQKDNYDLQMRKLQQSMQQNKHTQSQKHLSHTQKLPKIKIEDQKQKSKKIHNSSQIVQSKDLQNINKQYQSQMEQKQNKQNNNIEITNGIQNKDKRSASDHTPFPSDANLNDAEEYAKKNPKKVKINLKKDSNKKNQQNETEKNDQNGTDQQKDKEENQENEDNENKQNNEQQEEKSEDKSAQQQQEYYNSMTDSLFNGVLPSNATESMILDTLLNNPEYYDHKLGRCLCSYCDCGVCQRKCAEINAKLHKPNSLSWVSSYKKDFSDYQSDTSMRSNGLFINRNKSIDNIGFSEQSYHDLKSTMRADFRGANQHKQNICDFSHKVKESPFYNVSSYKSGFPNYGQQLLQDLRYKAPLTTHKDMPQIVKQSTNKEYGNFLKLSDDQINQQKQGLFKKYPRIGESGKREPLESLLSQYPNAKMDYLTATSKNSYQDPQKLMKDLKSFSQKNIQKYDKIPTYQGQYKTQNQNEYVPHAPQCKARGKIQQMLKDRFNHKHASPKPSNPQSLYQTMQMDSILAENFKSPTLDKPQVILGSKNPQYPNHPLHPKRVKLLN